MSIQKLKAEYAGLLEERNAFPSKFGSSTLHARLEPLRDALHSGEALKKAEAALKAAKETEQQTASAEENAASLVQSAKAMEAREEAAFKHATTQAGAAALDALKNGADVDKLPRPNSDAMMMARATVAAAHSELDQATQAHKSAVEARQSAEQAHLEAVASGTLLTLLVAELQYREALTAHHLTYQNAYRSQYIPSDVNNDAWYDARAILWGED